MVSEVSDSEPEENIKTLLVENTKKRKKCGRTEDVMKKLRRSTHELGEPCNCSRFKCFEILNEENRREIIKYFNALNSVNEQNFTMLRFIHFVVHHMRLLESIKITFPIRGHSYLECDKNMGLIDLKTPMELPFQWYELIKNSRCQPSPFQVIEVAPGEIIRQWTNFFSGKYMKKCNVPLQQQREVMVSKDHPSLILHRTNYNSLWEKTSILNKYQRVTTVVEFQLPEISYTEYLPISTAKYQDLMSLKQFCSLEAQIFYELLKSDAKKKDSDD